MGLGQRYVADLMVEIGLALIEPFTAMPLSAPLTPASPATISLDPAASPSFPALPLPPTSYLYPGAQLVLGWQTGAAEVVTVLEVLSATQFTADVSNSHAAGDILFGATFPTQQPTDPIFTQPEILGYIAQAQNEFLTHVPLIFAFDSPFAVEIGQTYQSSPADSIELERVAVQSTPLSSPSTAFPISTITRSGGTVTCVLSVSSDADDWTAELPVQVSGVADSSYDSAAGATFTLLTVSADGLTLTWAQAGADSSSSGGTVSRPVLTRLYESAQEQVSLNFPSWSGQQGLPPTRWAEDRAGTYGWLLLPPPGGNYFMELLYSQSGSEELGLLDQLLVPDVFAYPVKWKVLQYCFEKAGVQRSPTMAKFAKGMFDYYCLLADRFLRAEGMAVGGGGKSAQAALAGGGD